MSTSSSCSDESQKSNAKYTPTVLPAQQKIPADKDNDHKSNPQRQSVRALKASKDPLLQLKGAERERDQAITELVEKEKEATQSVLNIRQFQSELKAATLIIRDLEHKVDKAGELIRDLQDQVKDCEQDLKESRAGHAKCKEELGNIREQHATLLEQIQREREDLKEKTFQISERKVDATIRTRELKEYETKIILLFTQLGLEAERLGFTQVLGIPLTHYFPKALGGENISLEQLQIAAQDKDIFDDIEKDVYTPDTQGQEKLEGKIRHTETNPNSSMDRERKPFSDILKHIPNFKGKKGEDPVGHIDAYSDYVQIHELDEKDYALLLLRFGYSLGGRARLWFKENKHSFQEGSGDKDPWLTFIKAFCLKFSVAGSTEHELIQAWSTLKWNEASEDLDEFAYRIKDLAKCLGKTDKDILFAFRMGLLPSYAVQIVDKQTLREAKEHLKRVLAELKRGGHSQSNTGGVIPFMVAEFGSPNTVSFEDKPSGPMYKIERHLEELNLNIAEVIRSKSRGRSERERSNSRERSSRSKKDQVNYSDSRNTGGSRDYSRDKYDSRDKKKGSDSHGRDSRDSRDYSKDRGRDHNRSRDYSRDRGKDYSRDRDRDHSRDRDRNRDKYQSSGRDRDQKGSRNYSRERDDSRNRSGDRRSNSNGRSYSKPLSDLVCYYCDQKGHVVRYCDKMKRDKELSDKNSSSEGKELSKRLDNFRVYHEGQNDLEGYIRNLSSN